MIALHRYRIPRGVWVFLMMLIGWAVPPLAGAACDWWTLPPSRILAYPNTYTEYWMLSTAPVPGIGYRLTGQQPTARFFSLQTYPAGGALADFELITEPTGAYTVYLMPAGSDTIGANQIAFQDRLNLVMRITLPERPQGGVPLPAVDAFSLVTGASHPCRSAVPVGILALAPVIGPEPEEAISFYYLSSGDEFARNEYGIPLVAQLTGKGPVVLWFRVPIYPEETRMTMLCVHETVSTLTMGCLADFEFQWWTENWVVIVVGPPDPALAEAVMALGANYLSWESATVPLLIYRQILPAPDFEGSAWRVPAYDSSLPQEPQGAEYYMGDYAPVGMQI